MSRGQLWKKLRTIGILALIAAVVFAVRLYLNQQSKIGTGDPSLTKPVHQVIKNDKLNKLDGAGLVKAAENANLQLSLDLRDGNIEVLDKQGGTVWRSRPTPEEVDKDSSDDLWKTNMQSPVIVQYINDYIETLPNYANVMANDTKVSVFQLPGGARAYYEFQDLGIKIAVDYYLHDDHLEVDVPDYMIQEREDVYITDELGRKKLDTSQNVKIVGYSVLPFFGAVLGSEAKQGYLMVPDGPGALIRFDQNKTYNFNFTGTVYGSDVTYANKFDSSLQASQDATRALFPVFGINNGSHSVMAVIHQGESGADIIADPAGVNTGFYHAYAFFKFRDKYKKLTDLTGAGDYLYTQFSMNVSRNIKYYFLSGSKSSYAGMAAAYRQYLMKEKGLKRQTGNPGELPLELSIVGGAEKDGFIAPSFIPMTTFKQAQSMIEYLQQNGIRHMNIVYEGWASGGVNIKYPKHFPAANQLGGMKGLEDFIAQAHRMGYKVLLADNHTWALTGKGLSQKKDVVRDIQNTPLDLGDDTYRYQLLNTGAISRFLDKSIPTYQQLKVDGILDYGFDLLTSDFHPSQSLNREQTKWAYEDILRKMVQQLGSVRLWGGMAFELGNGVSIEGVPSAYSFSPIVDEVVPFYPMALHGLIDFVWTPYNEMDEPEKEMLQAIEYGTNVSFKVTAEPTERLNHANIRIFSSEFEVWKPDILRLYRRIQEALGSVTGAFMIDHRKLAADVYESTYDNGTTIVCNYSDTAYLYQGKSVAAMDFIVVKGSEHH